MHLTLTRFEVTPAMERAQIVSLFEQSLPRYRAVPGLLSKHYYLEEGGRFAGGVYLWAGREDAEAFLTPAFAEAIRTRFGGTPAVTHLVCPLSLDNAPHAQRTAAPL